MKVLLKYLPPDTTKPQVEQHFQRFLQDIRIIRIFSTDLGLKICEIQFNNRKIGYQAIRELHGSILNKEQINLSIGEDNEAARVKVPMPGQSDGKRIGGNIKCNGCNDQYSVEFFVQHAKSCSRLIEKKMLNAKRGEQEILARRAQHVEIQYSQQQVQSTPLVSKEREAEIMKRRALQLHGRVQKKIKNRNILTQDGGVCSCQHDTQDQACEFGGAKPKIRPSLNPDQELNNNIYTSKVHCDMDEKEVELVSRPKQPVKTVHFQDEEPDSPLVGPPMQLDLNKINLHEDLPTLKLIHQDVNENGKENQDNDNTKDERCEDNWKEKMYQDIKCAFTYNSPEKLKSGENDTAPVANNPPIRTTDGAVHCNSNYEGPATHNELNVSASDFEPRQHLESYRVFSPKSARLQGAPTESPVGIPPQNHPIRNEPAEHQGLHVPMPMANNKNLVNPKYSMPPPQSPMENVPVPGFHPGMLQIPGTMPVPGINPAVNPPAIGANPGFVQYPGFQLGGMNVPGLMPGVGPFAGPHQAVPSGPNYAPGVPGFGGDMLAQHYQQISHAMAQQVHMLHFMAAQQNALKVHMEQQQQMKVHMEQQQQIAIEEAQLHLARSKALEQQQAAQAYEDSVRNTVDNKVQQMNQSLDENANDKTESATNDEFCNNSQKEDEISIQAKEYQGNATTLNHGNDLVEEEMTFGEETIKEQLRIMEEIKMRQREEVESRRLAIQLQCQEEGPNEASTGTSKPLSWSKIADPSYRPPRIREKVTPPPEILTYDGDGWQKVDSNSKRQKQMVSRAQRERMLCEEQEMARRAQAEEEAALRTQNNLEIEERIREQRRKRLIRERKISYISEQERQQLEFC